MPVKRTYFCFLKLKATLTLRLLCKPKGTYGWTSSLEIKPRYRVGEDIPPVRVSVPHAHICPFVSVNVQTSLVCSDQLEYSEGGWNGATEGNLQYNSDHTPRDGDR